MKTRRGFVSNSSSTSFIIENKTKKTLPLTEFIRENPQLVEQFEREYYKIGITTEDTINKMCQTKEKLKPGPNMMTFGDEDGTTLGHIYDYILRYGGSSKRFSWRFLEYNR